MNKIRMLIDNPVTLNTNNVNVWLSVTIKMNFTISQAAKHIDKTHSHKNIQRVIYRS